MPNLNMKGPFTFTNDVIDDVIQDDIIGNYALGEVNDKGRLTVTYVGRSDTDLKSELKQRLDTHPHSHFKASFASSVEEAYNKECQNYHDFSPSENEIHPAKANSNIKCPICGQ